MTMAETKARTGPLIDFLGRSWAVESPVLATAFNGSTGAAAFSLDGGDVALARCDSDDIPAASAKVNADGAIELTPNESPPGPLTRVFGQGRPGLSLAADGQSSFLGGDRNGGLFSIEQDGRIAERASFGERPVRCVAAAPRGGLRACAVGQEVHLYGAEFGDPLAAFKPDQPVAALAFDMKGRRLAAAHEGGLTLWSTEMPEAKPKLLRRAGAHTAIAWSPDNRFIASTLADNALHAWRLRDGANFDMPGLAGPPTGLAWARKSRFLVCSGDTRVVCWPIGRADRKAPARADHLGIPSEILVTSIACNPLNDTIAAGYANGALLLYHYGKTGEMFVKGPGDGAVSSVAWSADGRHLGFGTEEGVAAMVSFPAGFFK